MFLLIAHYHKLGFWLQQSVEIRAKRSFHCQLFGAFNSVNYEMKKSKSSEPRDRLSELPDSLIFDIFWLLPMRDVVRTTILSNRWKNLWTTSPYLNFELCITHKDTDRVRNFLNRALIFWRGIKILKFRISFDFNVEPLLYADIDLWVRFAKENEVEELYLDFVFEDNKLGKHVDFITGIENEAYLVPQYLYSCPLLKVLSLHCCNLQINGNVHWDRLKTLDIDGYCLGQHLINKILSGSPHLEAFILTFMESGDSLNIQSSSLKKLSIDKCVSCGDHKPSMDTQLTIRSPNLESLKISGVPYSKCLLMDASSLTHATLGMHGRYWFSGDDFLVETLKQILPTIQNVENVTLEDWCLKVLGDMKKKDLLSPFPNVKFLCLNFCYDEYEQILGLLEIFPKLRRLVIQEELDSCCLESLKFDTNFPNSFLLQLRIVEVTWRVGDNIFPFIEVLLKYASKLERMVFRVKGNMSSNSLLLASQKLLRMKRSSPNAELICCEY